MAKEKLPQKNEAQAGQSKSVSSAQSQTTSKKSSGKKNTRSQFGGTAIQGAKSTLPRQVSNSNNPQQQEIDSYNRTMRRRMEQINGGPNAERKVKSPQERRKEKIARLKEKRAEQVQAVRRTLPGGQLKTDTSRAVRMVIILAAFIVLLIGVFVVLRLTGVIQ